MRLLNKSDKEINGRYAVTDLILGEERGLLPKERGQPTKGPWMNIEQDPLSVGRGDNLKIPYTGFFCGGTVG